MAKNQQTVWSYKKIIKNFLLLNQRSTKGLVQKCNDQFHLTKEQKLPKKKKTYFFILCLNDDNSIKLGSILTAKW